MDISFLTHFIDKAMDIIQVGDIFGYGMSGIIIFVVMMYVTFYTLKKVVVNLATAYVALFLIQYIFHITVEPTAIMMVLMAFFGPIPVVLAALWHFVG